MGFPAKLPHGMMVWKLLQVLREECAPTERIEKVESP
jgi:hypothetical protein